MGTLRFFEEVVSFKIRRTFGFADYKYRENDIRPGKKHVDKGAGIGFESDYFY